MKVVFTLLSLMIALFFAFALVNPVYAGEEEKEFKFQQFENKRVFNEEEKVIFVDDDFFFVDDDFFFPKERFLFKPFFGPGFLKAPKFFDD